MKNSEKLLVALMKRYVGYLRAKFVEVYDSEYYLDAMRYSENITRYLNVIQWLANERNDVEGEMTLGEFIDYMCELDCTVKEDWSYVSDWLVEGDWQDELKAVAENEGLEDAMDEVIEFINDYCVIETPAQVNELS